MESAWPLVNVRNGRYGVNMGSGHRLVSNNGAKIVAITLIIMTRNRAPNWQNKDYPDSWSVTQTRTKDITYLDRLIPVIKIWVARWAAVTMETRSYLRLYLSVPEARRFDVQPLSITLPTRTIHWSLTGTGTGTRNKSFLCSRKCQTCYRLIHITFNMYRLASSTAVHYQQIGDRTKVLV